MERSSRHGTQGVVDAVIRSGENVVAGVPVNVVRRRARHYIVRVKADGSVWLTVPLLGGTLAKGESFLASKWEWAMRTRERALANPPPPAPAPREFTPMEVASLQTLVGRLHALWAARLGEFGVAWKLRRMKTRWGVCNWVKRRVTYAVMLADRPVECVEYVVVHELTHLKAHGHGPKFKALMDARLPDWRERRNMLKSR